MTKQNVNLNDTAGLRAEAITPALARISEDEGRCLADQLRRMGFETRKNSVGMVMVSVRDSFDTPFHLGEALACETLVEYKNVAGWGLVLGDRQNAAFIAACVDAAARAQDSEAVAFITACLEPVIKAYQAHVKVEKALVKSTRVNFGLMVEG